MNVDSLQEDEFVEKDAKKERGDDGTLKRRY
jgi:hypothetical protein